MGICEICGECGCGCESERASSFEVLAQDDLDRAKRWAEQNLPKWKAFMAAFRTANKPKRNASAKRCLPGNCHRAATVLARIIGPNARVARGHWRGTDVRNEREEVPFQQHSWVALTTPASRAVLFVDPTQWVFTGTEPHITVTSEDDDRYDRNSTRLRELARRAISGSPIPKMPDRTGESYPSGLSNAAKHQLETIFGADRDWACWTVPELFSIANTSAERLGDAAREIFLAICDCGQGALVPIDTLEEYCGDAMARKKAA